jgi:regulator of protease activity HflC (stomatin/prohibitin superfamily)
VRTEADRYANDVRSAADRDGRRIIAEAQATAAAKVTGAEALAVETREAADARARASAAELAAVREQELTAIRHMRDVREALTQHLYATQNNLEDVLNQVVSGSFPALGTGEPAEPEGEVVDEEPPAKAASRARAKSATTRKRTTRRSS